MHRIAQTGGWAAWPWTARVTWAWSTAHRLRRPIPPYVTLADCPPTRWDKCHRARTRSSRGAGSQTGTGSRWGDYAMMSVDPTDDCTFWITTEYIHTTGTANWQTRVGAFKFPGCGTSATPTSTPVPPTATRTNTPVPPTATQYPRCRRNQTNTPTRSPALQLRAPIHLCLLRLPIPRREGVLM